MFAISIECVDGTESEHWAQRGKRIRVRTKKSDMNGDIKRFKSSQKLTFTGDEWASKNYRA